RDCVVGVQVADHDDVTTALKPLILFGDATLVTPSGTRYGAPSITAATQSLNQATEGIAGIVVPVGGLSFSRLCVHLSSGVGSGRTESFFLRNSTSATHEESPELQL